MALMGLEPERRVRRRRCTTSRLYRFSPITHITFLFELFMRTNKHMGTSYLPDSGAAEVKNRAGILGA